MSPLDYDVHFGDADDDVDWENFDDPDPDDEELEETPPDVVAMLGFDPRDEDEETEEAEEMIVSYPAAVISYGGYDPMFMAEYGYDGQAENSAYIKGNRIFLSERFFSLDTPTRADVLCNQIISFVLNGMSASGQPFTLPDKFAGRFGEKTIEGINGADNLFDNMKEAFKSFYRHPEWLHEHYPAIYEWVAKQAMAHEIRRYIPARYKSMASLVLFGEGDGF